jgi:hypothetical protein
MGSRSGRSTGPRRETPAAPGGTEVYLFPGVVGGGLGDIEEVLAAGRRLAGAGLPVYLYRSPRRPLPRGVDGPWDWPPLRRIERLRPRTRTALTVTPAWGVSAAPSRPGPLGRPGPWAEEVADLEELYGPRHVLHVSLEEFARTLDPREESRERLREGGVPAREIPKRLRRAERIGELGTYRAAFDRFRAFDRPNVLHLFATFRPDRRFARAYPHAVQTGPLWPALRAPGSRRRTPRRSGRREWVWYASPASAERVAPAVLAGLADSRPTVHLLVRSPRPWRTVPTAPNCTVATRPMADLEWRRRFGAAELRIVTGSRTLLEALEVGGPFLYFNGLLGSGRRRRRHRPEKIRALLEAGRDAGVPLGLREDLDRFARGERVEEVVRRVAAGVKGWERFAPSRLTRTLPAADRDAGELLVRIARALARPGSDAVEIVGALRRRENG